MINSLSQQPLRATFDSLTSLLFSERGSAGFMRSSAGQPAGGFACCARCAALRGQSIGARR